MPRRWGGFPPLGHEATRPFRMIDLGFPSGGGAGVVIATEVPGEKVAGNTVVGNTIYGNGLAGVTIHAHLPGQNLNGNRIIGNWIGTNNAIVTAVERGPASTRWRDFADVYALSARHPVPGPELVGSIARVADFRGIAPRPLADVLRDWQTTPPSAWVTWRRNQLLDGVPRDFAEVLAGVMAFADPAITGEALSRTWDPLHRRWTTDQLTGSGRRE
jgi:hypothetical protein